MFHFFKAIFVASFRSKQNAIPGRNLAAPGDMAMRMREVLATGAPLRERLQFPTNNPVGNPVPNIKQITLTLLEEDPLQSISKSAEKSRKITSPQITAQLINGWREIFDFPGRISGFPM